MLTALHLFDTVYKCCSSSEATSSKESERRLAEHLIRNVSLLDAIRMRRISRAFNIAGNKRLSAIKQIEVKVYKNLHKIYNHHCDQDTYERVPNAEIIIMEMDSECLGIAVDSNMKPMDVKVLLQLLGVFRNYVEKLFIDSPIIELLVSCINRQQITMLLEALRIGRKTGDTIYSNKIQTIATNSNTPTSYGPFFKNLKRLIITSTSKELEHLSRLSSYAAVDVDFLYETEKIDLLCLKIIIGGRWCKTPHVRLFRHVSSFRKWSDSDKLGEKYLQQFTGQFNPRTKKTPNSSRI